MLDAFIVLLIMLMILWLGASYFYRVFGEDERLLDERQLQLRYVAYSSAVLAVLVFNPALQALGADLSAYVSPAFVAATNYFLVFAVAMTQSLWLEAVRLERVNQRRAVSLALIVGLMGLAGLLYLVLSGSFWQAGHLYLTTDNGGVLLLVTATCLAIGLVGHYKIWQLNQTVDDEG